jgi:hypothetical protein
MYFFISIKDVAVCIICNEQYLCFKEYNAERRYKIKLKLVT